MVCFFLMWKYSPSHKQPKYPSMPLRVAGLPTHRVRLPFPTASPVPASVPAASASLGSRDRRDRVSRHVTSKGSSKSHWGEPEAKAGPEQRRVFTLGKRQESKTRSWAGGEQLRAAAGTSKKACRSPSKSWWWQREGGRDRRMRWDCGLEPTFLWCGEEGRCQRVSPPKLEWYPPQSSAWILHCRVGLRNSYKGTTTTNWICNFH